MAHGWDSYFNNLPPLSSDSSTLRRTSESEESLSQHIENFIGHHDFPGPLASNEDPAANSNFNTNYYPNPSIENSSSDSVYQRYYKETTWQGDGEQMEKDHLPRCGNGDIVFATDGLSESESFPPPFASDLQGLKQDCGMLATSLLEDYSDVSSCSDADACETKPSCKFMANNTVPKPKTDVNIKHSSSEWLFTHTENMTFSTKNPCPDMSETNVILPSLSNVKAGENIVECTQDKKEIPENTSATFNMGTTTGSETGGDKNDCDGCEDQKQKEDVARDLDQGKYAEISISGHENLTGDGLKKYQDGIEEEQITETARSTMTAFDNEQVSLDEIVLRKEINESFNQENEGFENSNSIDGQDRNMKADERDKVEVLRGERKDSGSSENENFDKQKSPHPTYTDGPDENMETGCQEKEIQSNSSQSSDPPGIKVSDYRDATHELRECTSALKSDGHNAESCLQLSEHQSHKSVAQDKVSWRPAVMSDGLFSNAGKKKKLNVEIQSESYSEPNSSNTDVNPCPEKEIANAEEKANTTSSDPGCNGSLVTSDCLSVDTSDKNHQGIASHVESCLQQNSSSTDINHYLEKEATSPPGKKTTTSPTDPDCSGPFLTSDSKEQNLDKGSESCLQPDASSADINPRLEKEIANAEEKVNTTTSDQGCIGSGVTGDILSVDTSHKKHQGIASHLESCLQQNSPSTDINHCLEKEATSPPGKKTTTSPTDPDCSCPVLTSDNKEQNLDKGSELCFQSDASNADINPCLEKEMTSAEEKTNTTPSDPGCYGFGVTSDSLSVDTSDKNHQGIASQVESCLQQSNSSTDRNPCLKKGIKSPQEKKTTTSPKDPYCGGPILTSDNKKQSVHNSFKSYLQSDSSSTDINPCLGKECTSRAENTNTISSPDQRQALHQSPKTLDPESLSGDVAENARESFEELETSKEEPSFLGVLYGEPLSREDSLCDTDETKLGTNQYKDTSLVRRESNSINHSEGQAPQLKPSLQMRNRLQPVVILNNVESINRMTNSYHCAGCQHTAHNVDHLIEHHHRSHLMNNFQFCKSCNLYLMNEQAEKHLCVVTKESPQLPSDSSLQKKRKHQGRHRCIRCRLTFSKVVQYIKHMRTHTGKTPFQCNGCGLYFAQAGSLQRHKRIPGRCKLSKLPGTNSDDVISETKTPPIKDFVQNEPHTNLTKCYVKLVDISKTNLCRVCGKSFSTAEKAKKHLYNIHKGKSSQSIPKLGSEKSQNVENETGGKYKCPLCPRLFKYSYNRTRHLRHCVRESVCGGKEKIAGKYRCPLCHATFTLPSNRYRHINTVCLQQCIYRLAKETSKSRQETDWKKTKQTEQKTQPKENEQSKQASAALTAPKTVPRYKCNFCPAVFCHASGKYRHMKKHELFKLTGKMFRYRNSVFSTMSKPATLSCAKIEENKDNLKSTEANSSLALSCHFCGKCFSTSQSLKKHERCHKGERPYHCLECGKGFKKRAYLFGHKIVHQRRIQCTVCRKILPTVGELIKHRSSHLKRGKLQCPDCHLQFQYPAYLLRHLDSHKNRENKEPQLEERLQLKPQQSLECVKEQSGPKQLQCSLCKEVFSDAQVLRKHCLTHISGSSSNQCPFCKLNFSNRRYLLRHMVKHTGDKPFSCNNCGKQFYRDLYLKLHHEKCLPKSDAKTKGSHQCSYCPRVFSKKIRLKSHHRGHKTNSLLLCSRCGQYFGFRKLNQHQKNCMETEVNTGLSPPNGNFSKSTSQTSQNVHQMAVQSNATKMLQFKCSHCTQRFRYRSLLLRHLVSHTGVQPYACIHCGHRYRSQTMCLQHEVFCDGVYKEEPSKAKSDVAKQLSNIPTLRDAAPKPQAEGEAEYKCKFCTKTFMKPRNLRRHILTHNEVKPYRCKACDSCFSRYDHLKVHQTRCKGRRSRLEVCIPKISLDDVGKGWKNKFGIEPAKKQETFECEVCSRSFSTQSKLSRHNTMFHITKLFKCTRCGSSFAHEKSLKKHRKMKRCRKVSKETNASLPLGPNPPTENVTKPLDGVRNRILERIQPHFNKKYKYICSYCPRAFGNSYQLSVHTRLHTGEKPFACDYCGQRFIRKDYLQRHSPKCNKKPQQNKVLCDRCGVFFPQAKLENHKKSCTSTPSLSKSTVCQSQQSTSQSPPKGFSCAYCSSRFLLFSQLQEHFLNAHKMETVVPPVSTAPLQHHLSSISNIKEEPLDENCDKQHSDGANLICKLDTALNTEVHRPFSCPECSMSFVSKAGLTGHLRTHTMEHPFNCKTCKRGFWNKSLLRNHYRKCRFGHLSDRNSAQKQKKLEVPLKAEIDFALNDSVLVFKESSKTSGTGVLQTNFSCKDDFIDESPQKLEGNEVQGSSSQQKKAVQYQCSECDKSFTDGLMLISHLEDHGRQEQEKKRNTCTKCGRVCTSQGNLEKHMRMHGVNKKYSCPDCSKIVYTSADLEIHRTCHDQSRPHACKLCNQRFLTRPALCNHYREDHPDDVYTCRFCNKTYAVKKSLARHYRKWHQKEQKDHGSSVQEKISTEQQSSSQVSTTGESDEDENNGSEDSDSDSAPYFPCHVCGKTFPTSESLEDHQRCHLGEKPYECAECGRCFFQASQLQQHQRMHKSEFQCQACGRGFVSLFALRKHKHTHGKSRPYRCSKCHFSFTGPTQLAEHMSTHREENFPCDICNRVFLSKSSRAEHRKIHSKSGDHHPPSVLKEHKKTASLSESSSLFNKELKYRCGVCSERFRDPEKLSEHGCMAAKERPYSCSECNKHFLHASHLKKHRTTHQLSWSKNEYPCNQCNNSFSSPQQFHSHLQSHIDTAAGIKSNSECKDQGPSQGFICPVCHRCFASATELIAHFPTHPDGTFECKICKMKFPSGGKLKEHKRSHLTLATEFECTECGQSFLGRDVFCQHYCSRHQQTVTENEHSNPSVKTCQPTYQQAPGEEEEIDVTGEDLYNCPVCSMQFSSKSSLLEHQNKQHSNEKPFKCELCGKTFAMRRYLREHKRRHRQRSAAQSTAQSAENKLKCFQCHAEFNTAQDLSLHMRLHAEKEVGKYRCDMCYKSFSQWSLLKQHQESHVGQVVYECTECDKAFAFPHLLEEHQQTHAGSSQ